MKVVIQIPVLHESDLTFALDALPRKFPGVDEVEWMVITTGAGTEVQAAAQARGVEHFVRAQVGADDAELFFAGLEASLDVGASLIVHADAANGCDPAELAKLVMPILKGEIDVAVASRTLTKVAKSPAGAAILTSVNRLLSVITGNAVDDSTSQVRAFSREAAVRLKGYGGGSYPLETLFEAAHKAMVVAWIPVEMRSPAARDEAGVGLIFKALSGLWRSYLVARPSLIFNALSAIAFSVSLWLGSGWKWGWFGLPVGGAGILLSGVCAFGFSGLFLVAGLFAEMLVQARIHSEELEAKVQRVCDLLDSHDPAWPSDNCYTEYFGKPNSPPEIH